MICGTRSDSDFITFSPAKPSERANLQEIGERFRGRAEYLNLSKCALCLALVYSLPFRVFILVPWLLFLLFVYLLLFFDVGVGRGGGGRRDGQEGGGL